MKRKSLPLDVVDQWPEVFGDIDVQAVPLAYLHSMLITFKDGKVWDINVAAHIRSHGSDNLEEHLEDLISSYEDVIENIDFRLDVERVKKDIIKKTRSFLKKPNKKK